MGDTGDLGQIVSFFSGIFYVFDYNFLHIRSRDKSVVSLCSAAQDASTDMHFGHNLIFFGHNMNCLVTLGEILTLTLWGQHVEGVS